MEPTTVAYQKDALRALILTYQRRRSVQGVSPLAARTGWSRRSGRRRRVGGRGSGRGAGLESSAEPRPVGRSYLGPFPVGLPLSAVVCEASRPRPPCLSGSACALGRPVFDWVSLSSSAPVPGCLGPPVVVWPFTPDLSVGRPPQRLRLTVWTWTLGDRGRLFLCQVS